MRSNQFDRALDYYLKSKAEEYCLMYLSYGKPGSSGYKYVEESLEHIRHQLFMEE